MEKSWSQILKVWMPEVGLVTCFDQLCVSFRKVSVKTYLGLALDFSRIFTPHLFFFVGGILLRASYLTKYIIGDVQGSKLKWIWKEQEAQEQERLLGKAEGEAKQQMLLLLRRSLQDEALVPRERDEKKSQNRFGFHAVLSRNVFFSSWIFDKWSLCCLTGVLGRILVLYRTHKTFLF